MANFSCQTALILCVRNRRSWVCLSHRHLSPSKPAYLMGPVCSSAMVYQLAALDLHTCTSMKAHDPVPQGAFRR